MSSVTNTAQLPSKEAIVLAAKRSLFRKSYYHFFLEFWSETSAEPLVDNWHIKVLCDELQIVGERLKDRLPKLYDLVINVPPASSKSTIVTVLFPVWLWTIDSSLKILTGSYAQSLSLEHAVKSRTVINSHKFKELYPNLHLKDDQNNKGSYDNTDKGNRTATSVGSGIIGRHYHVHIVDDPVVATATDLDILDANRWMTVTLSTRKISKDLTPTILVMQRIHQNDPSAIMTKRDNVKHICLPAELTKDTTPEYILYYQNRLFDPVRLSSSILSQTKSELGSVAYTGQYLQNPIPVEGGILKKDWFMIRPFSPEDLSKIKEWFMFVDSAYTDKTKNDPTGIIIVGKDGNNLVVRYAEQKWLEFPDLLARIKTLNNIYKSRLIYVEPKSTGKSIVQSLKKEGLNIVELEPSSESKLTRVNAVSPIIESKRVTLVQDTWNTLFVDECTSFPLATHDDMLDCLTYAIKKLIQLGGNLNYRFS